MARLAFLTPFPPVHEDCLPEHFSPCSEPDCVGPQDDSAWEVMAILLKRVASARHRLKKGSKHRLITLGRLWGSWPTSGSRRAVCGPSYGRCTESSFSTGSRPETIAFEPVIGVPGYPMEMAWCGSHPGST